MANKTRNSERNMRSQQIDKREEGDWSREDTSQFPMRTHIRDWVREEFLNRWRNFGLQYTHGSGGVSSGQATNYDSVTQRIALTASETDDPNLLSEWDRNIYKGPKTSWARICSNAIVPDDDNPDEMREGFILGGNGYFHDTYGFSRSKVDLDNDGGDARTLLGYDIQGKGHWIQETDYLHRPSPGLMSVDSEDIEPGKNFRRTTVNITCWSQQQVDYLDNYFFTPGMTMIVEWGWNTFPEDVLLDLSPTGYKKILQMWNNGKSQPEAYSRTPVANHIRKGGGNYGFVMGLITEFNYSIRSDGGYDCSVSVSCMSEVGHMIMTKTGRKKRKKGGRFYDLETFCKTTLKRCLVGKNDVNYSNETNQSDPTDQKIKANITGSLNPELTLKAENDARALSRGRYYSFNKYNSAKPYSAGKSNTRGGTYITVGYLIDIFNIFLSRYSQENESRIVMFSCWGCRAIAHVNIKSIDGSVLLIPNSLAPRWNTEDYHGSTITQNPSGTVNKPGAGYDILQTGLKNSSNSQYGETTDEFIKIVQSMYPDAKIPAGDLEAALKNSPRDDLHRILSKNASAGYDQQNPIIAGKQHSKIKEIVDKHKRAKRSRNSSTADSEYNEFVDKLNEAFEEAEDAIRPFPDFQSNELGNSLGYSGRIADLFVSVDVIAEAFDRNDNATNCLLDIMKQVSTAAGGIWDFQLMGGDTNTSSNTVLSLVDTNFSGNKSVYEQKGKSWVFPTHRGDSFVRELNLQVDPKSELSSQIVFGNLDKKNGFYKRQDQDLILKYAVSPIEDSVQVEEEETKPEIADTEKYIVSASSIYIGNNANQYLTKYPVDSSLKNKSGKYGLTYEDKNGDRKSYLTNSESEFDRKINDIRKMGKENTIKTKSNDKVTSPKTGSNISANAQLQPRVYQVQVQGEWLNRYAQANVLAGSRTDLQRWNDKVNGEFAPTSNTFRDDEYIDDVGKLAKYLVGKVIHLKSLSDLTVDKEIYPDPKTNINYKILDARVFRGRGGLDENRTEYPYQIHLQEADEKDYSVLDDSSLQHIAITKQKYPSDWKNRIDDSVKKKIKESKISDNVITQQQVVVDTGATYGGSRGKNLKLNQIAKDKLVYGTSKNDYLIDIEMVDPDRERMLEFCKMDESVSNNLVNNQRLDGVELSLKLDGIEGLRLMDMFNCSGVPTKYFDRGTFMISGVKHNISGGDWTTDSDAFFMPG